MRQPDARVIVRRAALLVAAALGAAGCPNQAGLPGCPTAHFLVAVAADSGGPTYVADDFADTAGYPYAVERANTLQAITRSTDDGTAIELLSPAAGGVIVVNGGAAARRFDATGTLLWTIGYGEVVGVHAGLAAGDQLVVADARSVRSYQADGTAGWERPLPATVEEIVQVLGDGASGSWVVGQSDGLFVLHLDGNGAVTGTGVDASSDNALSRPAAASKDATGAPVLVVHYWPDSSFYRDDAFDSTGKLLWTRPSTTGIFDRIATDSAGNLVLLSVSTGTFEMQRLDATGTVIATATSDAVPTGGGGLYMTTAPTSGGILVAGERFDSSAPGSCDSKHFLLRVDTASLAVTPLTLGLP